MKRVAAITLVLCIASGLSLPSSGREDAKGPAEENSGPVRIDDIKLEGCKQIPCRDLRSIMRQRETPFYRDTPRKGEEYDPFWAGDDRRRMETFSRSKGYFKASVTGPEVLPGRDGNGVKLVYRIQENDPVIVRHVKVLFVDGISHSREPELVPSLVELEVGEPFNKELYQSSASEILEYFKNEGYFQAEVERRAVVDLEAMSATVSYSVTKGDLFRLGSVHVEGCEKTGADVVKRAIDLEPGQRYRKREVLANQRKVARLPVYRTVRFIEEADEERGRIRLTIRVEEGKEREVKVGLGYGSEEGIRVRGSWRHVNFLGGARELSVSARWSRLLEREEIRLVQPDVRRSGDFLQLAGERRVEHEEAYTHEALSISPTYHFIIHDYLWAELSYKMESNIISRVIDVLEVEEEDLAREGLLSAPSARIEWSDIDDALNPREGAWAGMMIEYGGGAAGGDFNYVKWVGEAAGYYPLLGPVVGALKWRLGWADPLGELERLPLFLRFYAGGTGSVRGYSRRALGPEDPDGNPIGGVKLWEGSFELRFPIWKDLSGVVFEDSGWIWPEEEDYDSQEVAHGAGLGIRYNTPIGPLALDLGFPIVEKQVRFDKIRVHFNIGHTF